MDKAYEFYNKVKAFCRQKELFAPKDRVVVGLSGGADSVCLFLVLNELAKEWELTLFPVHVNHNLRGKEADRDRKFCEELCSRHNLELQVVSVPVAELAKAQGISLAEAGRNARYDAFAKIKEEWRFCKPKLTKSPKILLCGCISRNVFLVYRFNREVVKINKHVACENRLDLNVSELFVLALLGIVGLLLADEFTVYEHLQNMLL